MRCNFAPKQRHQHLKSGLEKDVYPGSQCQKTDRCKRSGLDRPGLLEEGKHFEQGRENPFCK